MQLLKTKKCCGCMDLRTGGLVIGYLSLFGAFINLEAPNAMGIGPFVASILGYGAWIYGIINKRTSWMLPGLILTVIGMAALLLNLMLIPLLGTVFREGIQSYLSAYVEDVDEETPIDDSVLTTFLTITWIVIFVCTLIHWHFMAVMFSLYKSMKEEEFHPNAPLNLAEAGELEKKLPLPSLPTPPPPYQG